MSAADNAPETDKTETSQQVVVFKRPRRLIALYIILTLFAFFAFGGTLTALLSHKEDPALIKLPSYDPPVVAEEAPQQPIATTPVAPITPQADIEQPEEVTPDAEQTESKIQFHGDAKTPAIKEKPFTRAVSPQSMIDWNKTLVSASPVITPHNVTGAPKIALVIDDMGLNRVNSNRVVRLPGFLTLAYLPYGEQLPKQTAEARGHGHELIVHVPMEPDNLKGNNPGPNALLTSNSAETNVTNLEKDLSQFDGYIGLNNHMGSRFTANEAAMRPILDAMKTRGLWFLDSRTIGNSVGAQLASEMGVPYVSRDVFLDNVETVAAVNAQLKQLEAIARKRGYAVAIGHPHDATIAALQAWIPQVQQKGFEFVSLSSIIAARFPAAPVPRYAQLRHESTIEPAAGIAAAPAATKSN